MEKKYKIFFLAAVLLVVVFVFGVFSPPAASARTCNLILEGPSTPTQDDCDNYGFNVSSCEDASKYILDFSASPGMPNDEYSIDINGETHLGFLKNQIFVMVFSNGDPVNINFSVRQTAPPRDQLCRQSLSFKAGKSNPGVNPGGSGAGGTLAKRSNCPKEGLVPCGTDTCPCTLCDTFVLIQKILHFITFTLVPPIGIVLLIVAGVMYVLSTGNPSVVQRAGSLLKAVLIGLIIVYASWLLVNTIMLYFVNPKAITGGGFPKFWYTINCPTSSPVMIYQ